MSPELSATQNNAFASFLGKDSNLTAHNSISPSQTQAAHTQNTATPNSAKRTQGVWGHAPRNPKMEILMSIIIWVRVIGSFGDEEG
jgi:hypothetical protein